jgi:hypothetical protein
MASYEPGTISREVIISGVDDSDRQSLDERLLELGIDFSPFSGPEGSVQTIRDMAKNASSFMPNATWAQGVTNLFADVGNVSEVIGSQNIFGHRMVYISPAIPNPKYKPPVRRERIDDSISVNYGRFRRYLKLSESTLTHWLGSYFEKDISLDALTVLLHFRESTSEH